MRGRARRARPPAGFTLIELLVVITVAALLALAVPSVAAGIPALRFRAEVSRLAVTLRRAHDDAVRTGTDRDIVLDVALRRYTRLPENTVRDLSGTAERIEVSTAGDIRPGRTVAIRFFGDGSATGASIRLSREGRSGVVTIDWLTGRVAQGD
jgi:general secretion pathway protein H